MRRTTIIEILSAGFILVFIYTSLNKFLHHHIFLFELKLSPDLNQMAAILSWTMPIIELSIASLFFFKQSRLIAFFLVSTLFSVYLSAMFILERYVPNIRGGILNSLSYNQYILLNSTFLLLAILGVILLLFERRNHSENKIDQPIVFT
jgi:hypothetical protein